MIWSFILSLSYYAIKMILSFITSLSTKFKCKQWYQTEEKYCTFDCGYVEVQHVQSTIKYGPNLVVLIWLKFSSWYSQIWPTVILCEFQWKSSYLKVKIVKRLNKNYRKCCMQCFSLLSIVHYKWNFILP